MKFKMNVPNTLTMVRIFCTPLMILMFLLPIPQGIGVFVALGIYVLACITDFLDGYIARTRNQVTTFGKFLDPLADKILVLTALVMLVEYGKIPAWIPVIVLTREFLVSGYRLVAVEKGTVIAAGFTGKLKTATTMFAIIFLFLYQAHIVFGYIGAVLMYLALAFTVISGVEYFWKNRKVILESV